MNVDNIKEEQDAVGSGAGIPEGEGSFASTVQPEAPQVSDAGSEEAIRKPGAQLAAFRKAAGIDQEQVAASLKMTVRQVRELEADNYDALHGIAISRGFVRAYAKMLQVDPEPLAAMFVNENTASKQLDQIPRQGADRFGGHRLFGKRRGIGKTGWVILIVVVLALVYSAHSMKWFSSGTSSFKKKAELPQAVKKRSESPPKSGSVSSDTETPRAVASEPEKSPGSPEGMASRDAKPAEAPLSQKTEDKPKSDDRPKEDKPDAVSQALPQAEKRKQPESGQEGTAGGKSEKAGASPAPQPLLVVRFKAPSRVRVLKADSSALHELDGRAGDVKKVEINEPVTVVAENAASVEMRFREQPLVLRAARRSSEARVELK